MDQKTIDETLKVLTPKQREVLDFILQGKSVAEISAAIFRSPSTVSKHLSAGAKKFGYENKVGEYFSYRWDLIELFAEHRPDSVLPGLASRRRMEPEFPDGPVSLDSPFYIERAPIEKQCFKALAKPSALLRICAPKQMGKSSLMSRSLAYMAEQQSAMAVVWDLMDVESEVCRSLEMFLKSFCWGVTQQLGLDNKLSEYWDGESFSKNQNCTAYFGEYILPNVQEDVLVVGLDDVDRIFEYEMARDFFALLRSWHEKSKTVPAWKKLRLVLAYSTEEYAQMDIHQSPFNVGRQIALPEFSLEQVQVLAQRHGPVDKASDGKQPWGGLYRMVGGHPYLVRLALYYAATGYVGTGHSSLAELLQAAPTAAGIYDSHLRKHWQVLTQHSDLAAAMKLVVTSPEPVTLTPGVRFKLHRLGLLRDIGQRVAPRCELYRLYFSRVLEA